MRDRISVYNFPEIEKKVVFEIENCHIVIKRTNIVKTDACVSVHVVLFTKECRDKY